MFSSPNPPLTGVGRLRAHVLIDKSFSRAKLAGASPSRISSNESKNKWRPNRWPYILTLRTRSSFFIFLIPAERTTISHFSCKIARSISQQICLQREIPTIFSTKSTLQISALRQTSIFLHKSRSRTTRVLCHKNYVTRVEMFPGWSQRKHKNQRTFFFRNS